MRSMAQDALGVLSDELDARSRYGEMEAMIGDRLGAGVRTGLEGALSVPIALAPVASLPARGAAVATLPGALGGSRAVAPVVNVSIDTRGGDER
jgi:hypothetical protein